MNPNSFASCTPTESATLTDTLRQTESALYSIGNLIDTLESKIKGPMPCGTEDTNPKCTPGILEQAVINLKRAEGLYSELSLLIDRL